jgi:hypothetical protein
VGHRKKELRTPQPMTPALRVAFAVLTTVVPLAIAYGTGQRIALGLSTWAEELDMFLAALLLAVVTWTANLKDCETHTIRALRLGSVYVGLCSSGPVIYPGYNVAKRLFKEERATELLQHLSQQGYV